MVTVHRHNRPPARWARGAILRLARLSLSFLRPSLRLAVTPSRFGERFIDRPAMTDGNDPNCPSREINLVDDPEATDAIAPEPFEVTAQRNAAASVGGNASERLFDAALHVRG